MEYIHDHADYGFTTSDVKFNWGSVVLQHAASSYPPPSPFTSPPHARMLTTAFYSHLFAPSSISLLCISPSPSLLPSPPPPLSLLPSPPLPTHSTIKKARDDYVKRLNGIYYGNLQKVISLARNLVFIPHLLLPLLLHLSTVSPFHPSSPPSLPPPLSQDSVEYIKGHATFTGPKEVTVGDQTYTAEHILVATGTKPIIPQVPGESCDGHVTIICAK